MGKQAFDKFISKSDGGAKKKEAIRQEKRQIKAELKADQEARKKEISKSNEKKYGKIHTPAEKGSGKAAPGTSENRSRQGDAGRENTFRSKRGDNAGDARKGAFDKSEGRSRQKDAGRENITFRGKRHNDAGNDRKTAFDRTEGRGKRNDAGGEHAPFKGKRSDDAGNDRKTAFDRTESRGRHKYAGKGNAEGFGRKQDNSDIRRGKAGAGDMRRGQIGGSRKESGHHEQIAGFNQDTHPAKTSKRNTSTTEKEKEYNADGEELMPLNKFIAHAGICGRREGAILVKDGLVTVNGDRIFEPGFKVSASDKVTVKSKPVFLQKNLVYILLNKPKDYITTAKDPEGRKTVLELIKGATQERVYPVGRLDRNTTGVLLLTNDGELAQKLTHPSYEIKKIYEVKLDKPLVKKDFEAIINGITLEDGFVQADAVAYADAKDKSVIGIQIHSGRNRIVRRIFEHLGYDVKNLDRVMFANLTKKNVDRSKWRLLSEKEVRLLKFMNQSFVRKRDKKDA